MYIDAFHVELMKNWCKRNIRKFYVRIHAYIFIAIEDKASVKKEGEILSHYSTMHISR